MYKSLMIVPALACFASFILTPAEAFGALTLVLGGTAYVLTATQTSLAIASLAGLAVAKEALVLAELSRSRGKRSVDEDADFQSEQITSAQFDDFFDVQMWLTVASF